MKVESADMGRYTGVNSQIGHGGTLITGVVAYAYKGLSVKPRPKCVVRHPQDDLLVVYALSLLAQEHEGTQWAEDALCIAAEIADQHGLTVADAILQLE